MTAPPTAAFVPTVTSVTTTSPATSPTTSKSRRLLFRRKGPRKFNLRPRLKTVEQTNEIEQKEEKEEERREEFNSFPAFRRLNRFRPNKAV